MTYLQGFNIFVERELNSKTVMTYLQTNNICLRELCLSDKDELTSLANNPNVSKTLRDIFPHPYTTEDAKRFINYSQHSGKALILAIVYNEQLTGVICLEYQQDVYRKSAELVYWLGEKYWNKGIASNAVSLICSYAFHKLKLNRIFASVFSNNQASVRVLEKNGFKQEGRFKAAIVKNNEILDELRYSILH